MRKITNVSMTIDYTEEFNFCNMYQALDFVQLYIQGRAEADPPRIELKFEVKEVEEDVPCYLVSCSKYKSKLIIDKAHIYGIIKGRQLLRII